MGEWVERSALRSDDSEEEGAGERNNADPPEAAEARVAAAVRLEEDGRKRREARMEQRGWLV